MRSIRESNIRVQWRQRVPCFGELEGLEDVRKKQKILHPRQRFSKAFPSSNTKWLKHLIGFKKSFIIKKPFWPANHTNYYCHIKVNLTWKFQGHPSISYPYEGWMYCTLHLLQQEWSCHQWQCPEDDLVKDGWRTWNVSTWWGCRGGPNGAMLQNLQTSLMVAST